MFYAFGMAIGASKFNVLGPQLMWDFVVVQLGVVTANCFQRHAAGRAFRQAKHTVHAVTSSQDLVLLGTSVPPLIGWSSSSRDSYLNAVGEHKSFPQPKVATRLGSLLSIMLAPKNVKLRVSLLLRADI